MSESRQQLGVRGERVAERFLRRAGMKTLARRYRTPVGELDLIMRERDTLVFVEVKTRTDRIWSDPQDAVNATKQRRMARIARWYLRKKHCEDAPCRFDIVAVIIPADGEPEITHFPDAFVCDLD